MHHLGRKGGEGGRRRWGGGGGKSEGGGKKEVGGEMVGVGKQQRDIRNIVWDMVDILQQPKIVWVMETL